MSRRKEKELARRRRNDKFRRRRSKRKQLLISNDDWGFESREVFVRWVEERSAREGDLRSPCSCQMCGNPRRHFDEKTKAEVLFEMEYQEAMEDVEGQAKTD